MVKPCCFNRRSTAIGPILDYYLFLKTVPKNEGGKVTVKLRSQHLQNFSILKEKG